MPEQLFRPAPMGLQLAPPPEHERLSAVAAYAGWDTARLQVRS
jgi:hypothetical protein